MSLELSHKVLLLLRAHISLTKVQLLKTMNTGDLHAYLTAL